MVIFRTLLKFGNKIYKRTSLKNTSKTTCGFSRGYSIQSQEMSRGEELSGLELETVVQELNKFGDLRLAESWDNVGLLVEPTEKLQVRNILLTNDLTESVLEEALVKNTNLILSYHPPIFAALKRVTNASWKERIVAKCLEKRIAIYSPHTAWDAVFGGVTDWLTDAFSGHFDSKNRVSLVPSKPLTANPVLADLIGPVDVLNPVISSLQQAEKINLIHSSQCSKGTMACSVVCSKSDINVLLDLDPSINVVLKKSEQRSNPYIGMGRMIHVNNLTLSKCVDLIKKHTGLLHVRLALAKNMKKDSVVSKIAFVPGSGGSLLRGVNADLYITGEMFHHDILEANHNGASVILTNHSDSERGFLKLMKLKLEDIFTKNINIIVSESDKDPIQTV